MNERYLLLTKAIGFSNQLLLSKYFFGLYHHIKDQQLHDDRMKFQNAGMSKLHLYFISSPKHILTIIVINFFLIDKYYELRLCETVLFRWRKVTRYSHDLSYMAVMRMRLLHSKGCVLSKWKSIFLRCRILTIQCESTAMKLAQRNRISWIMRKFKLGVEKAMLDRKEDEAVAAKMKQLKMWLDSPNSAIDHLWKYRCILSLEESKKGVAAVSCHEE